MINQIVVELLKANPNATLWDFLHVWYEFLHGSFPVTETDDDIVELIYLHLSGYSPGAIAKALDIERGNVVAYLKSMEFRPWTYKAKDLPMLKIYSDWQTAQDSKMIMDLYGVSKHMFDKIIAEFSTAREILSNAN